MWNVHELYEMSEMPGGFAVIEELGRMEERMGVNEI
jgi:hypothetical protein